jgi:hypothetical protein
MIDQAILPRDHRDTPEELTMLRNVVLAAVVLAATAPLAFGDDPKPPVTPLERIESLLKDLSPKIAALQADVAALKQQTGRLDSTQNVLLESWEMRNQIESLQTEVARLKEQLAASRRAVPPSASNVGPPVGPPPDNYQRMPDASQSFKMTEPSRMPPPSTSLRPALGTFRIINELPRQEVVRVNGHDEYVLAPGDVVDVPLPPGPFTYQVLGIDLAARTMTSVAGKVATATIHR